MKGRVSVPRHQFQTTDEFFVCRMVFTNDLYAVWDMTNLFFIGLSVGDVA